MKFFIFGKWISMWNFASKDARITMLPPNSRPPNLVSSQIHGFIPISWKFLIHGF